MRERKIKRHEVTFDFCRDNEQTVCEADNEYEVRVCEWRVENDKDILYTKGGSIMAKVLVVDDAAFMRMSIQKMLEPHGHVMIGEAENGIEAVKKYMELKPDIVLLDITMPEMNGVEALKQIKEKDPSAKVVICSAMGQQAMVAQAIQYGAKDFVVKPFEVDRLIAAIDRVMEK